MTDAGPRMDWERFLREIDQVAPRADHLPDKRLAEIPAYQRIRILRWVGDFFEQPTPMAHLEEFETLGELQRWMDAVLVAGEPARAATAGAAAGTTGRVRLRPLLDQDIVPLYRAAFDPANASQWRYRGRTFPLDQFVTQLFGGVVSQYMVEMTDTGQTVGLVTAYDENPSGLNCKVAFLRCGPRVHGDKAAVFEGMLLFITFLFRSFPFRKLFAEVPAQNMSMFTDDFATEEGVLKEYLFCDGEFVDLHYVSMQRDRWMALAGSMGW